MIAEVAFFLIGQIFYYIAWFVGWVCGLIVALEAYFVGEILNINAGVFNAPIIQVGFSAALSLANLGFVFGIIVIAIATILRRESYGIKQLLWKLVVMAILVNFGLVIVQPIFNFSNQLTTYFLGCVQTGGGCGTVSTLEGAKSFATALASAFQPQRDFLNTAQTSNTIASGMGGDISKIIGPTFGLILLAGAMIVIVMTLATFIFMLLVRYVYIAILAVLLPLAWMLWVFPNTQSYFSRWWGSFIRWTFFAPVVLFFMWLAIMTSSQMSNSTSATAGADTYKGLFGSNNTTATEQANSNGLGGFAPLVGNILNEIVLVGLMIGGMIAANELSITGSSATVGAMKSIGASAGNYSLKQGKKGSRLAYQKAGGEKITAGLQEGRIGRQIQRLPLLGGALGGIVRRGESLAGRAISKASTNQALVDESKKKLSDNPEELKRLLIGSMNKEDQLAAISKLVEKGELKGDENINGKNVKVFLDENPDVMKRFGQGLLGVNANKVLGSNKEIRDAERALIAGTTTDTKDLDEAVEKFVRTLGKADVQKMNVNNIFAAETELSKALARGFLKTAPQLTSSLLQNMKSPTLHKFEGIYSGEFMGESRRILNNTSISIVQRDAELQKLRDKHETFQRSLANNVLFSGTAPTAATPPPPATP